MSYKRAEELLPKEVIELIQKYVDGENIYIPRKENTRSAWGEQTSIRQELLERNRSIYLDYQNSAQIKALAEKYFLSVKSIQRIIRDMSA